MKLSILIPTTYDRQIITRRLLESLLLQIGTYQKIYIDYANYKQETFCSDDIEIILLWDIKGAHSIGTKRNHLLLVALGEYIAFVDSDDRISDNYISLLMDGIDKGVDCCSLRGIYSENGIDDGIFEHSIKYNEYKTHNNLGPLLGIISPLVKYERYPNHLNCIKSSIAKKFIFLEKNYGEDTDWATQIHKSGLIKTEHYIPEILYHYDYQSNK